MKQASVCSTDQGGGKRCSGMLNSYCRSMMLSTTSSLSAARSPASLQLLGHASAAQRAADANGLVPHAFVRLLRPEDRLAMSERHAHPLPDRVRLFARE